MRTFLTLLAMTGATASSLAQAAVNFNNTVYFLTAADRLVRDFNGAPLVGTNFAAQLYYGPTADNLRAVTNAPARLRVPTTSSPGTWVGGTRTLVGFNPGDTVWLQVRVWDRSLFPDYESAVAGGGVRGQSCSFAYTIPPAEAPPEAFWMENFPGIPGPMDCGLGWFTYGRSSNELVLSSVQRSVSHGKDLQQTSWQPLGDIPTRKIPMTNEAGFFLISRPAQGPGAR